jgi:short-subunit dehydrogenase
VLINNAGYAVYGTVEEVPIDATRRQLEVNISGLVSLTKKIRPL